MTNFIFSSRSLFFDDINQFLQPTPMVAFSKLYLLQQHQFPCFDYSDVY